jgi:hypothetical protein
MVRRPTGGVDCLECEYERGEIERRLYGISQTVESCDLARDPPYDAPRVREDLFGITGYDG